MKLKGKNVIITGGSQGLGKEIARHCLTGGASVAVCARNPEHLKEAYGELSQYKQDGRILLARVTDVSDRTECESFAAYAADHMGPLQVLINNAGIHGAKSRIDAENFDFDGWAQAVHVNLFGTLYMCLAVVPYLKRNTNGKIINLSGGGATSPMPGLSAYAASKAAVVRLTETLALELKPYNIDVNAVAPGAMNTRLLDDVLNNGRGAVTNQYYDNALRQKKSGGTPLNKAAELCVYLASDESKGVTGKLISAVWDNWPGLHNHLEELNSDVYTLRRIVPEDRGIVF